MMMITDAGLSPVDPAVLSDELAALGEGMGLQIRCMQEDIFQAMHRI